jgi:cytochrome c oxidase subunit 2
MRDLTKNPDFEYELVCDQLCGASHYAMKGAIEVVTQEEYDALMAKQKPAYYTVFPAMDPSNKKLPTDSTSKKVALLNTPAPAKGKTK